MHLGFLARLAAVAVFACAPALVLAQATPPLLKTLSANDNSQAAVNATWVQSLLTGRAPLTSPSFTGFIRSLSASNTLDGTFGAQCDPAAGVTAPTSYAWVPSCWGVAYAPGQNVIFNPTRGTAHVTGDRNSPTTDLFRTTLLSQARIDGATKTGGSAITANLDLVGGSNSVSSGNFAGTGLFVPMRARPGPNGERPPMAWGLNTDILIEPGSNTAISAYGWESDINISQDCAVYSGNTGCQVFDIFLNGHRYSPSSVFMFSGGGLTSNYTGTVTVANNVVTWASGYKFVPAMTLMTIAGTTYRVTYTDATHMAAETFVGSSIPNQSSAVDYSSMTAMVHDGILFSDGGAGRSVSDNDLYMNTAAYNGLHFGGNHGYAINVVDDATRFAMISKAGQATCFNTTGGCLRYDSTAAGLVYSTTGTGPGLFVLADNGNLGISNGLTSPAAVITNFNQPLSTPASSTAACSAGDRKADANYVYVCVAANTWKRAALSSW